MKRAIFVGITTAALSLATAVQAEEHVVLILPDAYFPSITYMNNGDTVRFVNASGVEHNIISKNGNWSMGPLNPNGEETMVVDNTVQKTFYNAASMNSDGTYAMAGIMSFANGPIE